MPDDRESKLTVLRFDTTKNCLLPLQQVTLPEGTLMPIGQVINQQCTKLFTTAGRNGVAHYRLDPILVWLLTSTRKYRIPERIYSFSTHRKI